jgi:hypothetical protein
MRLLILVSLLSAAASATGATPPARLPPIVVVPTPTTTSAITPSSKPDEATVAEAIRLLDTDGFDESAMRSIDLTMGIVLAGMVDQLHKQYGDALPSDFVEQLRTTIHDYAVATMRAHLQDMKRQTAEIYAEEFTRAELVHLRELHTDPVAVKARDRAKVMQPKLMKIGVMTMKAAQPELDAKIKRLVTDYLAAHGKTPGSSS